MSVSIRKANAAQETDALKALSLALRAARVAASQTTLTIAKTGLLLLTLRLVQLCILLIECLRHGRHFHGVVRILGLSILVILWHRLKAAGQLNWIFIRVLSNC